MMVKNGMGAGFSRYFCNALSIIPFLKIDKRALL
jgi:hypothetical protein